MVGHQIATGFSDLWAQAGAGFNELLTYLSEGPLKLDAAQLQNYVTQAGDQLKANSGTLVSGALSVTTTIAHVLAGALIALFCTLFFLKDGALIWTWLLRLLPAPARGRVHEAGRRGLVTLGAFTRTQILVAFIDAVGIGLGALLLGLPLVVPLAVLVFLASFVPFVGAIATGAIAVLVALVDQGPGSALIMLGVVLVVQQVEGHVLQPLLLGHAVSVHPVAVLLSVAAGSLAAGVVGALFAVPFVATLNTVVLYLHGHDKFPDLGSDPGWRGRLAVLNGEAGRGRRTGRGRPRFEGGRTVSAVTRDEIVAAQKLLEGCGPAHARGGEPGGVRGRGRPRRAQVREPSARRVVQDPRRVHPDLTAQRRGEGSRRGRRERRQPRAGCRVGRPAARAALDGVHAGGCRAAQDRRDQAVRRPGAARRHHRGRGSRGRARALRAHRLRC